MPDDQGPGGALERAQQVAGQLGAGVYSLVLCFVVLAAAGAIGIARKEPWVFPSLGPTVMLFFESPRNPTSTAKNAVVGHLVGIAIGAACLYGFNLDGRPPAPVEGLTWPRVVAAALSVAVTALVLRFIKSPHPPAGATTLIVSLGVLQTNAQLRTMALAVVVVTALGWGINRLLGVRHPLISPDTA